MGQSTLVLDPESTRIPSLREARLAAMQAVDGGPDAPPKGVYRANSCTPARAARIEILSKRIYISHIPKSKISLPWVQNVLLRLGYSTTGVSENTLTGKTVAKILRGSLLVAVPCAIFAGPTLAAIKLGSSHLSQLAESSRAFESASLVVFGIGFLSVASAIRRWQSSIT